MKPFKVVKGIAAPMPLPNIDTDVIMPKQFLKRIDREGLAEGLFHDLRYDNEGNRRPDFILNQPEYRGAKFLVCGQNFGCGSSREHAVWGLLQNGIRAVLAPSFAGIFFGNCEKNGLLAITLPEKEIEAIISSLTASSVKELAIDLEEQSVELANGHIVNFEIDTVRKQNLLLGLDHIAETLKYADDIREFEKSHGLN